MTRGKRLYLAAATLLYTLVILGATVLNRSRLFLSQVQAIPLRSYAQWLAGDGRMGLQIVANILLFVPLGYLCAVLITARRLRSRIAAAAAAGFCLSLMVEIMQLAWRCGQCDVDDLISNTLGALAGGYGLAVWEAMLQRSKGCFLRRAGAVLPVVFLMIGGIGLLTRDFSPTVMDERSFAFAMDQAEGPGEEQPLGGYCFIYGEDAGSRPYTLRLRDLATGRETTLPVRSGIERPDAAAWFADGSDYLRSGFELSGGLPDGRYELMICWGQLPARPTGYYLMDGSLVRAIDTDRQLPGILLVSLPEAGIRVSQLGDHLIFAADDRYGFSQDGQTHIVCHLWTTQPEHLPPNRQEYGFDNLDFYFEAREIAGASGCRLARIELPGAYAITSIEIGGETGGSDKWYASFRPVIRFTDQ